MLMCVAVPWAVGLSIGGLWLCLDAPSRWPGMASPLWIAGLTVLAAGQLVFLVCVADRVCPLGARVLAAWLELPICVLVLLGAVALVWHAGTAMWSGGPSR